MYIINTVNYIIYIIIYTYMYIVILYKVSQKTVYDNTILVLEEKLSRFNLTYLGVYIYKSYIISPKNVLFSSIDFFLLI